MKRPLLLGLGTLGVMAAALVAGRVLGSRPDEPGFVGPLPTCTDTPNCYRARRAYDVGPEALKTALDAAVREQRSIFSGSAIRVTPTETGLRAVFRAGPFRDDVAAAIEPGSAGQSVLHVRSASRVGESDLGVNRLRVRRLLDDVARRLA
ncbi:DUF1499 domain-containing protein [Rubrivirga sp. S365]|uniref:DUF1499 domain-containing protein n=1 Tax=Rubrivirga litoralis TaxID=3075598 RepID=A0ABU3BVB6_9BACT|nr:MULTISPECIES: DUF1499 domain-containing protein [unclassified Rubrivirga]MDT0633236.1 DUF1499 domain-containing protein [Rubrivirga sp. F394]MDT7855124.1 DUF1499 domain-containing protein [Rubrivirga sp. S365]